MKRYWERKALEEKEQRRVARLAARRHGGAIEKLYADSERMQDTIGEAVAQTDEPEARAALILAGEHYRKMRDCIVRGLFSEA